MERCFLVICFLAICGCNQAQHDENMRAIAEREKQVSAEKFNESIESLEYWQDPRTGCCFAFYWGGAGNGGPALATIPCEKVPPGLLRTKK